MNDYATELPRKQVAVVGVGWSGGIIASELAKAGIECIGLERGSERKINDFIMQKDELRYAVRYELMQDLSKETLSFRNDRDMRALPMRQMGSFLLGTDLGGAGIHWNGQCPRFFPYDFEIRSQTIDRYGEDRIPEDMNLQDWGISYDEIEEHFSHFDDTIGTSGEDNEMTAERSSDFPTPPMKKTPSIRLFHEAAENLGSTHI